LGKGILSPDVDIFPFPVSTVRKGENHERYFMNIPIIIKWDSEAEVWLGINDDIGLALESGSYDALIERIKIAVPEMLELNGFNKYDGIDFLTEKRQVAIA